MSEPQEVVESIEKIKSWLTGRTPRLTNDPILLRATESLKSIGVVDLKVDKFEQTQQDRIVYCFDQATQKPSDWTELAHLTRWVANFHDLIRKHKKELVTLELIRMNKEHPLTLANYHVEEAINIVSSATSFKIPLDMCHPDTKGQNYAADNVLVEDGHSVADIIRETIIRLYSKCAVRLVVKFGYFCSAALATYLVDLMHEAGATTNEVQIYAHDRRESLCSERLTSMAAPNKHTKLSAFAVVFATTDLFAAVGGIIEGYFREQYQNLIVLVEEAAYSKFIKYWQHYYSHTLHIGSRLDEKVTVVDTFNDKVTIDLGAIDISLSHKMSGNAINILRFRTLNECVSLINHLRKIPLMSVWNNDVLLSREFCARINQCEQFWINHMPKYHHAGKLIDCLYHYHQEVLREDMLILYDKIYGQHAELVDGLHKDLNSFLKKDALLRNRLIFSAQLAALNKSKSLRNGSVESDLAARLQLFLNNLQTIRDDGRGNRCVEESLRPLGLVIIYVQEELTTTKQKAILLEMVFKSLVLGNAVLLHCPPSTLGAKFSIENDHVIPFRMVSGPGLDMSTLNLSAMSLNDSGGSGKRKCPSNTVVVTFETSTSAEQAEAWLRGLGCKRKAYWMNSYDQSNYWTD